MISDAKTLTMTAKSLKTNLMIVQMMMLTIKMMPFFTPFSQSPKARGERTLKILLSYL